MNQTEMANAIMDELNKHYDIKSFEELLGLTGFSSFDLASAISLLMTEGKIQVRINSVLDTRSKNFSRREFLFSRFKKLVSTHYQQQRQVEFYASELCVTSKYLSTSVKMVSGRTAREWINDAVLREMKYQLIHSGQSIKEIAYRLNFPSISFFGKFFKKQTGMSPTSYRRKHEIMYEVNS